MAFEYFTQDQTETLVARLIDLTKSGRLTWRPPKEWQPDDPVYRFFCNLDKYGFAIESKDSDDHAPHLLKVVETTNKKVRELQDIDSTYLSPDLGEALEDLYITVKRITLKTDVIASEVLDVLERASKEPEPPF